MDVSAVVSWLVEGARGATRSPEVITRMSSDLRRLGLPIDRTEAFVRTLHPHIAGRSFVWRPGQPAEVHEQTYEYLESAGFSASPVGQVFRTGEWARRTLTARMSFPDDEAEYLSALAGRGYRDLIVAPLHFLSGQVHAVSFATKDPNGFSDEHTEALAAVIAPLARITEIFAQSKTAANLLDTYVGHGAGERILAGKVVRGDIEVIRAVVWCSDLRGFTSLLAQTEPAEVVSTLNEVFDCQVPAIERHGGEVLKFMGDGLLGIFPLYEGQQRLEQACKEALQAADEAFGALIGVNARRIARKRVPVRFGLGLHVGELAYGNVGGAGRLDFTCIGSAVNVAARLEDLTSRLNRDLLVTEDFAKASGRDMDLVGEYEVKGVTGMMKVYAPQLADEETIVP